MRIINGRIDGEIYDAYYSTGGGSLVGGGSDVWVNHWIKEVSPHFQSHQKEAMFKTTYSCIFSSI